MKKSFIIFCIMQLVFCISLRAQTYKNGVWYSIYDDATHTMDTQDDYTTDDIFAPTSGTLNVKWKYEWRDLLGAFKKIDTDVLESSNGGSATHTVGSLAENTDNNSNTTEVFTIHRNINWIKFNRFGLPTHKVHVYHIDIPLARHILLASGTYGTTTATKDFGEQNVNTTSTHYRVEFRSFLTAGDITITSSDPAIFQISSSADYAVGANACASDNGSGDATATHLGKISYYDFDVYFAPQAAEVYTGSITITDGVSTATINLQGTGVKSDQTITWEQETEIYDIETIGLASASSGLAIDYEISDESIVSYEDSIFTIHNTGQVTITAKQEGNEFYHSAADVVKTFTILSTTTTFAYQATTCQGTPYSDENFTGLTAAGVYKDTLVNALQGDSIITLTLIVTPSYHFTEELAITEGEIAQWRGRDLSNYGVGRHILNDSLQTILGCDSIYTLNLGVRKADVDPTYSAYTAYFCKGDSVEFLDTYYRYGIEKEITLVGGNALGGDSIIMLTVIQEPLITIAQLLTVHADTTFEWHGQTIADLEVGEARYTDEQASVHGCDSTYALVLTVVPAIVTPGDDDPEEPEQPIVQGLDKVDSALNAQVTKKVIINGSLFILKDEQVYDVTGRRIR